MVLTDVIVPLALASFFLGGIYILISLGMSLVFGVMDIINFAHGGFVMIGGYIALVVFNQYDVNPLVSLVLVVPVLFVLGYAVQYFLLENVLEDLHMNSLLLTFGLAIAIEAGLTEVFGNQARFISLFNVSLPFNLGMELVLAGTGGYACAAALFAFLVKTETGQAIRATAQVPELAKASGINVTYTRTITMGIGSVLAGVGGTLYLLPYQVSPIQGRHILLIAFIVVVLGGMGSLRGTVVAGLIIATIQQFVTYFVSSSGAFTLMFFGTVLILLVKPHGLFGVEEDVTT